jgi:outer membrane immunogenic protein
MLKFMGGMVLLAVSLATGAAQAAPGFYFGADAGWSQISDHSSIPSSSDHCWWGCESYSQTGDGFIAGVHAGYGWQRGLFVFGLEGDVAGSGADNSFNNFCNSITGYCDYTQRVELKELTTLRGRVGYDFGGWVPYVTGGLAVGLVRNYVADNNDPGLWDNTEFRTGYIVGGGVEYAWSSRISLRVQGEYYDLGSRTFVSKSIFDVRGDRDLVKFDDHCAVVTFGVSYNFGS